jgi:hypothetical protein
MAIRIISAVLICFSSAVSQQVDIVTYPDSSNKFFSWYEFKPLGIKFRTFSDFHEPFDLRDTRTLDISNWKSFCYPPRRLTFRYPPSLTLKVISRSTDYPSECDSIVQLVVPLIIHYSSDSTQVTDAPVIQFYFTKSTLKQIAHAEGFRFGHLDNPFAEEDSVVIKDTSRYCWIALGRQGMEEKASVLDGPIWKGLRGENLTGLFSHEQGYQMSVPFVTSFLRRPLPDGCSVVATFYEGPVANVEDEFNNTVTEGDFYYLVLSIQVSQE